MTNVIEWKIAAAAKKLMDILLAELVSLPNALNKVVLKNLEYPLANGQSVKLLEDNNVYWGNQIEISGSDRCYGLVADDTYMLVCEYGCNGDNPEIIIYKKR